VRFGTDGVRGVANTELTASFALDLGRAAARVLAPSRAVVGGDTRMSTPMLEAAVTAGLAAEGVEVHQLGVLPTPAVAFEAARLGAMGVVVSASHNPYRDNGIKFFGADGYKLSDAAELDVERRLDERFHGPPPARIGRIRALHGTDEDYLRALHERFRELDLSGRRVLLDCANGATYEAGPEIFRRLGAHVDVLAAAPDGRNINAGCGSTHLETLRAAMAEGGHDAGFAFDGDGDRVLAVDRTGAVVDGDELIALAAKHLGVDGVAVTVMTNYGFHAAMDAAAIEVATTSVGDRYVLEALRERGWRLGGEQSGHIIDMGFVPSGDGIAAALLAMEALEDGHLDDRHAMEKLPQTLVNVRVRDRGALEGAAEVHAAVDRESAALEGRGRVLLRPSGTEPLVRVMVEAPTADEAESVCSRLVALVEAELT
jgi:phosphoglucosamine mutase